VAEAILCEKIRLNTLLANPTTFFRTDFNDMLSHQDLQTRFHVEMNVSFSTHSQGALKTN